MNGFRSGPDACLEHFACGLAREHAHERAQVIVCTRVDLVVVRVRANAARRQLLLPCYLKLTLLLKAPGRVPVAVRYVGKSGGRGGNAPPGVLFPSLFPLWGC